jgi:hypothetical protein
VSGDAVSVGPEGYSVVFENEGARVLEVRAGPGVDSPMHPTVWFGHEDLSLAEGRARAQSKTSLARSATRSRAARSMPATNAPECRAGSIGRPKRSTTSPPAARMTETAAARSNGSAGRAVQGLTYV